MLSAPKSDAGCAGQAVLGCACSGPLLSRVQYPQNLDQVASGRPRVSDVVNQKTAKFTIDTVVEMLSRVWKPVRLAMG